MIDRRFRIGTFDRCHGYVLRWRTVHLMLPVLAPRKVPASILVIEDEVLIRMLIANELREVGFSVVEAARADDALSYLKMGGKIDLVFSDIQMPGSLTGLDLARLLRSDYPLLPIILTSGNLSFECAADVGPFVPKPYDVQHVVALVLSTLGLERHGGAE
jgi:CheY-like chemotaxis protein